MHRSSRTDPARPVWAGTLLAVVAAARALPAQVEGEPPRSAVQITPYVWTTGLAGSIQPTSSAPRVDVRRSFGELLEDLDAAFFVTALARRDRFVLVGDLSHVRTSREGTVPTGNPAAPTVGAEGRLRQTALTVAAGYRIQEQDGGTLDVLAGARAWWLRPEATVPALGTSASADVDFVDPVIGVRGNIPLAGRWRLLVYGDFGGFGVGSDVTAQFLATANVRVARHVWISGGYRGLTVEYEASGVRADAHLRGPLLGGTFTF